MSSEHTRVTNVCRESRGTGSKQEERKKKKHRSITRSSEPVLPRHGRSIAPCISTRHFASNQAHSLMSHCDRKRACEQMANKKKRKKKVAVTRAERPPKWRRRRNEDEDKASGATTKKSETLIRDSWVAFGDRACRTSCFASAAEQQK